MKTRFVYLALVSLFCLAIQQSAHAQKKGPQRPHGRPDAPPVAKASPDAKKAIAGFTLASGLKANLFAAEPDVANPVAFQIDEMGRFFVCETFRIKNGAEDNRDHPEWLDDDLASTSVGSRLKLYQKHLKGDLSSYQKMEDRVRVLQDTDSDGVADSSRVFVSGFNDPLDGVGAGVLSRHGNIYYACIPKLWAFRDDDDDAKADRKTILHEGYGVHVSLLGHDLHGLQVGPDGRLYFSIGDRGYNIQQGKTRLANNQSGAIFSCELDGSQLEVIATGFRNPQDLVFDRYGNLFTADNNSDNGDLARWVHVIPGSDSGWRIGYQYAPQGGPWLKEGLWMKHFEDQPAYILPPSDHIGDGPSGLACYPGTGLKDFYRGTFFLCDFRGTAGNSGVRSFQLRPKGATFEIIGQEIFLWNCLATDIQFGVDGAAYVSDWVDGWNGEGKGRIYRLFDPDAAEKKMTDEVRSLLASRLKDAKPEQLIELLGHLDQRVRMEAQFQLTQSGAVKALTDAAFSKGGRLPRIHAIWALGHFARLAPNGPKGAEPLIKLLNDPDSYIRAAAAATLGNAGVLPAQNALIEALDDDTPSVQLAAVCSLAKMPTRDASNPLLRLAARVKDDDPHLRHAIVYAVAKSMTAEQLATLASNSSSAIRMAAVLALRRQESELIAPFLADAEPRVAWEAAYAIHDVPITAALPKLADRIRGSIDSLPVLHRVLNANFRLGGKDRAAAIARFAAEPNQNLTMRIEALDMLAQWATPDPKDRVTGQWLPIPTRFSDEATEAIRGSLNELVQSSHDVRSRAVNLAGDLGIKEAFTALEGVLWDPANDERQRAGALLSMQNVAGEELNGILARALKDDQPRVRTAARMLLAEKFPDRSVPTLNKALQNGEIVERQSAPNLLAKIGSDAGDRVLADALKQVIDGKIPQEVRLDIVMAARTRKDSPHIERILAAYDKSISDAKDPLSNYQEVLAGGDVEMGRQIYVRNVNVACVRCHKVDGEGGRVGPDLTHVAKTLSAQEILESIVLPNKSISKGFDTVILTLKDGRILSGIVASETDDSLELVHDDGTSTPVKLAEIESRDRGQSAMPADLAQKLNLFQMRHLLAYLNSLK